MAIYTFDRLQKTQDLDVNGDPIPGQFTTVSDKQYTCDLHVSELKFTTVVAAAVPGEVITGTSSNAVADVIAVSGDTLEYARQEGSAPFEIGENVTGDASASLTNIIEINAPAVEINLGDVSTDPSNNNYTKLRATSTVIRDENIIIQFNETLYNAEDIKIKDVKSDKAILTGTDYEQTIALFNGASSPKTILQMVSNTLGVSYNLGPVFDAAGALIVDADIIIG